jgi:hypothetical protein
MNNTVSQSRTYVAVCVCSSPRFNGYYFRKFTLPEGEDNDSGYAAWYFLNKLNYTACIDGCYSFEDFQNIKEEK